MPFNSIRQYSTWEIVISGTGLKSLKFETNHYNFAFNNEFLFVCEQFEVASDDEDSVTSHTSDADERRAGTQHMQVRYQLNTTSSCVILLQYLLNIVCQFSHQSQRHMNAVLTLF